jgi:hypothetical protein
MKVKISNKIYDSEKEPIMIILSIEEIEQISFIKEPDDKRNFQRKFCSFPDGEKYTTEVIENFMKEGDISEKD